MKRLIWLTMSSLDPVWEEYIYVPVHDRKAKFVLEVMDYQEKGKDKDKGKGKQKAGTYTVAPLPSPTGY